jgi:hypothetical protein
MSIAQILTIIRNHTGVNANDKVKITHKEVTALLRAAHDDGVVTMGARSLLLGTLATFGGNEIHPDIFSSAADKAAIVKTSMEGIETPAKFAKFGARSQLKFVKWTLAQDLGRFAGFVTTQVTVADLPPLARSKVNSILSCEIVKAGSKFDPQPAWVTITAYQRAGGTYGYECVAGWANLKHGGYWIADFYMDQNGDTLMAESAYEPPDE